MRKIKKNEFYAGTKKSGGKSAAWVVACVLTVAVFGAAGFFGVRWFNSRGEQVASDRSVYFSEPAFDEAPLAGVSDVKYYAPGVAVYTDSASGRLGLITLKGEKTTTPGYTAFSRSGEGWQNYVYSASPVGQDFPRIVNINEKTVDKKQYEAGENAGRTARWNDKLDALAAYDSLGNAGVIRPEELCLNDGLYAVEGGESSGGKYGYVDENLTMIIKPAYDLALDFSGGMGAVCSGGKWGFIDESGKMIIAPAYSSVGGYTSAGEEYCFGFSGGAAPVLKNGFMGLIDKDGKTVVDFTYEIILPGEGGKYMARKNGKWGIITVTSLPAGQEESTAQAAPAGGKYIVNTSKDPLNIREQAQSGAKVVGRVPKGQTVTVTKIIGDWAKVTYGDIEGFAAVAYLQPADEQTTNS